MIAVALGPARFSGSASATAQPRISAHGQRGHYKDPSGLYGPSLNREHGRLYRGSHTRTNPCAEDRKRNLMQLPPLIDAESELDRYTSAVAAEAT